MSVRVHSHASPPPSRRSRAQTAPLTHKELPRATKALPWKASLNADRVNQAEPCPKRRGVNAWSKKAPTGRTTSTARMAQTTIAPAERLSHARRQGAMGLALVVGHVPPSASPES